MHRKQKTPPKRGSKLVGERGFEPPTHWSQTSCATKLRYSPTMGSIIVSFSFQSINFLDSSFNCSKLFQFFNRTFVVFVI